MTSEQGAQAFAGTWEDLRKEADMLKLVAASAELEELMQRVNTGHERLREATRRGADEARDKILDRLEELGVRVREADAGLFQRRMLLDALLMVRVIAGPQARIDVVGPAVEFHVTPRVDG